MIGPSGYTSLDAIAQANTQKADEPTFFEKVKNFFGGGDDKPTPVAGGRGRTVERPNERSDYLAKILDDQFDPVPPPNVPPVPELFNQFNDASGNIFTTVYNPQTQKYEIADNEPSKYTLNKNDITSSITDFIPPQLRAPLMVGGQYDRSIPHALVDNIIGLDDGVLSAGEAFGQQFNEDELGTLLDMGIGAAQGAFNLATSPIDTVGGYLGDVGSAATRLRGNRGTADEKLGDLFMLGSVVPAAKVAQLGGQAATIPLKKQAARFNDPYMESERLLAARGLTNVGTAKNPQYTGVERPSFIPDAKTASTQTIAEYRGRKKLADYLYENGATHAEVINTAGINRVTYKTPSGESITRDFMLLERPQINAQEVIKMIDESRDRLITNPDGTFDLKPDFAGYKTMEEFIEAMAAGKVSQADLSKRKPGVRFLSEILENPEDFAFLSNQHSDFDDILVKPDSPNIEGKLPDSRGSYSSSNDEITYNPNPAIVSMAQLVDDTLTHEIEHGIQYRGDPSLPKEGQGGIVGAADYASRRLVEITDDYLKVKDMLGNPNVSLNPAQRKDLNDYKSKLEKELETLDVNPFQLYSQSPIEVLARGAVKGAPLTTRKIDVPFTGIFNPYIKGQTTPLSQGIGALYKDYKTVGPERFLKNLPLFLTQKGYGARDVPIAYEEMMPYRRRSTGRPDQLLGMPIQF